MWWILPHLWLWAATVASTALFHKYCIVDVPAGVCELKERFERFGKKRFTAVRPGKIILFPFLHARVVNALTKDPFQMPMDFGFKTVSTGIVMVPTLTGETIVVVATFDYKISDPDAYVRDEYVTGECPDDKAILRARQVITAAANALRMTSGSHDRDTNARAFRRCIDTQTLGDATTIVVRLREVSTFGKVVDLPGVVAIPADAASASA